MSINQERMNWFRDDLSKSFAIDNLIIEDESHLHAGHAGAATGGGHFRVSIIAPDFQGMSLVERHRAIYTALNRHIPKEIHALTIVAQTPEEAGL